MAAAGVWPTADEWMPLVHEALVKLWTTETDPSITEEHAALATVGLLALHRGIALHDVSDPALREGFEELRQEYTEWREWLANAPAHALSGYSAQLAGAAFGTTFERTDFRTELSWLLTRSALHDAVDELPGAQLDGHGAVRIEGHGKRKAVLATLDALRAFVDI
ncbi:hypothetical protein Cme02nite_51090 [Catellatospora methionotrophica]|uniref:Uncharacterized protein n=1 Tax=Catellatospora methionotrophica TaxID=121620 RepID=A0A8J3LCV8_9ACTN|nr:hypothetical protein [Catellatospora methionotrophica]GIG16777.1 hypothetical protein Cme02nite_51090 [Catellatospora methionotrophica]